MQELEGIARKVTTIMKIQLMDAVPTEESSESDDSPSKKRDYLLSVSIFLKSLLKLKL
jgi:hypothetical protein